jgi:hypothetical protein
VIVSVCVNVWMTSFIWAVVIHYNSELVSFVLVFNVVYFYHLNLYDFCLQVHFVLFLDDLYNVWCETAQEMLPQFGK